MPECADSDYAADDDSATCVGIAMAALEDQAEAMYAGDRVVATTTELGQVGPFFAEESGPPPLE